LFSTRSIELEPILQRPQDVGLCRLILLSGGRIDDDGAVQLVGGKVEDFVQPDSGVADRVAVFHVGHEVKLNLLEKRLLKIFFKNFFKKFSLRF